MKKYLPYANYLAAGAGILGALLRQWTLVVGPDSKGLYPAAHPGWIGYVLLTAAALAAIWLLTRGCSNEPACASNHPTSIFPVAGHILAGCGIGLYSFSQLGGGDLIGSVSSVLGFVTAAVLLVLAWQKFQGKAPLGIAYLLPCLFFALQLFLLGKNYSTETQLLRFLPQFLALAASSLASYQLLGFGAELGNRKKSLFWSLSAACLCFSAAPGAHWMYAGLGLWHLLSHCTPAKPAAEISEADAGE